MSKDTNTWDLYKSIQEKFQRIDEEALTVIKSHLLIERFLDIIIEQNFDYPEFLELSRLNFSQKIPLARAIKGDTHYEHIWDTIKNINKIRNMFAHRLDTTEKDQKINQIISIFQNHPDPQVHHLLKKNNTNHEKLKGIVFYILGVFATATHQID